MYVNPYIYAGFSTYAMVACRGSQQSWQTGGIINTAASSRVIVGGLTASLASAILALLAAAPANADTVLMVGGADVQAFPGAENGVYMPAILGGYLCKSDSGNQCFVVPFSGAAGVLTPHNPQPLDASVATAADRLIEQIRQTPGPKIAVGYSAGASVVEEAAERLNRDPNGPPADELSLITVGSINDGLEQMVPPGTYLNSIGYTVRPPEPTKYPKTVVTDRHDGLASSMPNPMAHPLAALNNLSGAIYSHLVYFDPEINVADPSYLVSREGNVSHLVLPSQTDLPLAQALRDIGQPHIADALTGAIQDDNASAANGPANANNARPMSPQMVDQLIGAAAPTFVSLLNNDKDKLVDELLPFLAEHPEMFSNIPLFAAQDTAIPTVLDNIAAPTNDGSATQGAAPGPAPATPGS